MTKKIITSLIFIFSILSSVALAQQVGDLGTVNSSDGELNVRSGPSTKTTVLTVLNNGDQVKVLERSDKWARISKSSRSIGWVYVPLLAFKDSKADAEFSAGDSAFVCNAKTDKTNVRYGPSAKEYSVLASLKNNHKVQVKDIIINKGGFLYYEIVFTFPGDVKKGAGYVYHNALKSRCGNSIVTATNKAPKKKGIYSLTDGRCVVVAAARQTPQEVVNFFRSMDRWVNPYTKSRRAYLTESGWYAVTLGTVNEEKFESTTKAQFLRNSAQMPRDIYCSKRDTYLQRYDDASMKKQVQLYKNRVQTTKQRAKPVFNSDYDFKVSATTETTLKQNFQKFAQLWTEQTKQNAKGHAYRTAVINPHYKPSGLQWCQFKINSAHEYTSKAKLAKQTRSSIYGDAVIIGENLSGTDDAAQKRRQNLVSYSTVAQTIRMNTTHRDTRTENKGYKIANCESELFKGSLSLGHKTCMRPIATATTRAMAEKRWHALTRYARMCAKVYELNQASKRLLKNAASATAEVKTPARTITAKVAPVAGAAIPLSGAYEKTGLMLKNRKDLYADGLRHFTQNEMNKAARNLHTALVMGEAKAGAYLNKIYFNQSLPTNLGKRYVPKVTAYRLGKAGEAAYVQVTPSTTAKPKAKPTKAIKPQVNADTQYIKFSPYSSIRSVFKSQNDKQAAKDYFNVGSPVQVIEKGSKSWVKVTGTRNGSALTGWVKTFHLTSKPVTLGHWTVVGGDSLSKVPVWRRQKAVNEPVAKLELNSQIHVMATDDDIWAFVQTSPNKFGWVYKRYLQQPAVSATPTTKVTPKAVVQKTPKPVAPKPKQQNVKSNALVSSPFETKEIELVFQPAHLSAANDMVFSPDGAYLATTDFSGSILIWDAKTGQVIRRLINPNGAKAKAMEWTQQGLSWFGKQTLYTHDLITNTTTTQADIFGDPKRRIVLARDADTFITAEYKEGISLWQRTKQRPDVIMLEKPFFGAYLAQVDALSGWYALSERNKVFYFGQADGSKAAVLDLSQDKISASVADLQNKRLIVGDKAGKLRVYDMAAGKWLDTTYAHKKPIESLVLSPNSKLLAVDDGTSTALIMDASTFAVYEKMVATTRISFAGPSALAFSENGKTLAMWNDTFGLETYLWAGGINGFKTPTSPYNTQTTNVLIGNNDNQAIAWRNSRYRPFDLVKGKFTGQWNTVKGLERAKKMKIHPGSDRLAFGGSQGNLTVLQMETGTEILKVDAYKTDTLREGVLAMDFNDNGSVLVASGIGVKTMIWDLMNGGAPISLGELSKTADTVQISRSQDRVLTVDYGGDAAVWSMKTGELLWSVKTKSNRTRIGPSGKTIISEKFIYTQDDPQSPIELKAGRSAKLSVLSPDGQWAYALGNDKIIRKIKTRDADSREPETVASLVFTTRDPQSFEITDSGEVLIVRFFGGHIVALDKDLSFMWEMQSNTDATLVRGTESKVSIYPPHKTSDALRKIKAGNLVSLTQSDAAKWVVP